MVKSGKLDPFVTHLYYILQILNRTVKVKTLRPPETYIILITPQKQLSQIRTLKLHMNLCNNHSRGRVTPLQRLRSTMLLLNVFRKMSLVFLEAANTTYALILTLTSQRYADIVVCKILFQPLSCAISILYFHFFPFFSTHTIQFSSHFSVLGVSKCKSTISTKTIRDATFKISYTIRINKHHHSQQHQKNGVLKHRFLQQQP